MNPHFFQPLLPGFHSHLNIPVRFFMQHTGGKDEHKTAKLRSDVSHRTWEVKMVGRRFSDGWEEFANDHDLRIGDFLVFRHEGNMVFHVTGFGTSCCNLQYASSCSDDDDDDDDDDIGDLPRKKKLKNNPRARVGSSSDNFCFVAYVTVSNLREDRLFLPRRFAKSNDLNKECHEIVLMTERGRSWTSDLRYRKSSGVFYVRRGWRSFCKANGQKAGGFFVFKLVKDGTTPVLRLLCPTESSSDITPVECSEAEKEEENLPTKASCVGGSSSGVKKTPRARRTIWRASSSPRQNCFVTLTLTPYCYKKFKLYLPLVFTRVNGIDKPGKITMVDKHGVEWPTNLLTEAWNGKMHLGKGYRRFCEASDVKVGDSFMLELLWRDETPVLKFCSKVKSET